MPRDHHCDSEQSRLFQAILKLENEDECRRFFEDICTIKELNELVKRLSVAEMLREGKNYLHICKETGASTATISRVNRALSYGAGGYETVFERMKDETNRGDEDHI